MPLVSPSFWTGKKSLDDTNARGDQHHSLRPATANPPLVAVPATPGQSTTSSTVRLATSSRHHSTPWTRPAEAHLGGRWCCAHCNPICETRDNAVAGRVLGSPARHMQPTQPTCNAQARRAAAVTPVAIRAARARWADAALHGGEHREVRAWEIAQYVAA